MQLNDFDYHLPVELIAQFPLQQRSHSRLLCLQKETLLHEQFNNLSAYLRSGDLFVFNDSKVIPARLLGQKSTGGKIECLIERVLSDHVALAHIRASHAPSIGSTLLFENNIEARVVSRQESLYEIIFMHELPLFSLLEKWGCVPLPPYIDRDATDEDRERYQTVYAKNKGAIAAPTAGLHFDQKSLQTLQAMGVEFGFLTLHVGAGTFQPIRVENLNDHRMHGEIMVISDHLCKQIKEAKKRKSRIIAVGTTVARALETVAMRGEIQPFSGETHLFIQPGFQFQCVDMLLTNFHLPKSTLLMLVCAFGGYHSVMNAYQKAVENNYRFYSYGDAMLLC